MGMLLIGLQTGFDPAIFGTIGQILSAGSPVLVAMFAWLLYKGDLVSKTAAERLVTKEAEERAKAETKAAAAHAAEIAVLRAAQQREREQFEASEAEKRLEIEQWQQRWAKAASGAERAIELLLQQKAT